MRSAWSKSVRFLAVLSIFTFGTSLAVSAEEMSTEEKSYAKQGGYLAIIAPYNEIGGDFDGETVLTAPTEILAVSKVESDWGWGISFGSRGQKWAGELTYLRSEHDITWLGAIGEAVYNQVSFDVKRYFLVDKQLQPIYCLDGYPMPGLSKRMARPVPLLSAMLPSFV